MKRKWYHKDRQEASDLKSHLPFVLNFGSPKALTRVYLKLQSDNGGLLNQIQDLKYKMRVCGYKAEVKENESLRKLIKYRRSIDGLHQKIDDLHHALWRYEGKEKFHSSHTASSDGHSAQEHVEFKTSPIIPFATSPSIAKANACLECGFNPACINRDK